MSKPKKKKIRSRKKIPLFSVITPTYNSEKYLQQTIDSIKRQKFKNFEFIIIDGKSKDNTLKIIKKKLIHY